MGKVVGQDRFILQEIDKHAVEGAFTDFDVNRAALWQGKNKMFDVGRNDNNITGLHFRPESKKQKKELWIAGSCCGIALFFASNLQQLGISMGAESGKAGFLTATYILMVPILGIFP